MSIGDEIIMNHLPWLIKNVEVDTPKEIKYPIFGELMTLTDDPHWKDVLRKLGNDAIAGFRFYRGRLTYRGAIKHSKLIVSNASLETLKALQTFVTNNTNSLSAEMRWEPIPSPPTFPVNQWSDLRNKKPFQKDMIGTFVRRLTREHSLTEKESNLLQTIIAVGINLKIFNNETIRIDDGVIVSIDGLQFDVLTRSFQYDFGVPKVSGVPFTEQSLYGSTVDYSITTQYENDI